MLLEALQIYEDSLCPGCGMSGLHSYDIRNTNKFELVDDVTCVGCEAAESDTNQHHGPGQKSYVRSLMSEEV